MLLDHNSLSQIELTVYCLGDQPYGNIQLIVTDPQYIDFNKLIRFFAL